VDSLLIFVIAAAVAWIVKFIFEIVLKRALKKTKTEIDDEMVKALKVPIFWTVFIGGSYFSITSLALRQDLTKLLTNILVTAAIFLWSIAIVKISRLFLKAYDRKYTDGRLHDAIPFLDNLILLIILGIAVLLVLDIWGINTTPLLASAGVLGIAVAFAAKDTVSNLFGGVSVFFDRPYKVGDYVIIEDKHRGEVIEIGMRSTKIRTRDSVLITVPNSVMVTNAVINETGFDPKLRIRIPIGVAYNSDLDKVEYTLVDVMKSHKEVIKEPSPRIRFRKFGNSTIELEALCVIHEPADRGRVMHELIKDIDKAFKEEKISMPFPQRDVHLYKNN
jgi:small-conductance mechanosensitive channel